MHLDCPRDPKDESLERAKILLIGAHDQAVDLFNHEMKSRENKENGNGETPEPEGAESS